MRDWLSIGSSPSGEDCAQIGDEDYYMRSRKELRAFIKQLAREFPSPPQGAYLAAKSFPHDYGSYTEIVVFYDDTKEECLDWALKVEAECPEEWDGLAKEELGL
jgi:hypothetical protein